MTRLHTAIVGAGRPLLAHSAEMADVSSYANQDVVVVGAGRVECLDPALAAELAREGPAPRLSAHHETSVPGLFVVGAASAPTSGPVMRFMFGARHAAPTLARRLSRAR